MQLVWGLYLFSLVSGIGFERSHAVTNLNEDYVLADECIKVAKFMNSLKFSEKQIGLERGTGLRYVCIAKASIGTNL